MKTRTKRKTKGKMKSGGKLRMKVEKTKSGVRIVKPKVETPSTPLILATNLHCFICDDESQR